MPANWWKNRITRRRNFSSLDASVVMNDNKQYAAVLSQQPGSYVLSRNLQLDTVTDAIDIVDLANGQVVKSIPNLGEQVVYVQFKDNDTLQLALASGELLDSPIATGKLIPVCANCAEAVTAVDAAKRQICVYS